MTFAEAIKQTGISCNVRFVPFSRSRHDDGKPKKISDLKLCYQFDVMHNGRVILSHVDYSKGIAHCPSYKLTNYGRISGQIGEKIRKECETGKVWVSATWIGKGTITPPSDAELLAAILLDSEVINYRSFADWAENFGLLSDSIKAKEMYDLCLSYALALRAALGSAQLETLMELANEM